MTDRELADAAWLELTKTTDAYPTWKRKGFPSGSHWAKAKGYLDMIGRNVVAPSSAPLSSSSSGPSGPLHTHELKVDTGSTNGGGNDYAFVYPKPSSATTQDISGVYRSIAWRDSGDLYYAGMEVWVLYSWKPTLSDQPGRVLNFHNHPVCGGWLDPPHRATGVSAVAFDWKYGSVNSEDGSSGFLLALEANGAYGPKHGQVFTDTEMNAIKSAGTWIDMVVKLGISTTNTGYVKVWVQGESSPRVNLSGCQTAWELNSGIGPQTGYTLWAGIYNSSGVSTMTGVYAQHPRVGRTLNEALYDGITTPISEPTIDGSTYRNAPVPDDGSGATSWTHNILTSRDASAFQIGTGLS